MAEQVNSLVNAYSVAAQKQQERVRAPEGKASPLPESGAAPQAAPKDTGTQDTPPLFGFQAQAPNGFAAVAAEEQSTGATASTEAVARAYREALEKAKKAREEAREANGEDAEPKLVDEDILEALGPDTEDDSDDETPRFVPSAVANDTKGSDVTPQHAKVANEFLTSNEKYREQVAEQRAEKMERVATILRNPELYGFEA